MTYKRILLFLAMVGCSSIYAAREWEQFLRANNLYKAGNIHEALEEYQALSHKGPVVWYNIGICYLAQERYLDALIALYKARVGAEKAVNSSVTERLVELRTHFSQPSESWAIRYAYSFAAAVPLLWTQLLLLLLWYAFLMSVVCIRSRFFRWLLVFLCCCASLMTYAVHWVHARDQAVVLEQSELRVGPQLQFHTVGCVDQALLVNVVQRKEEWCKIKSGQITGWIESSRLAYIESSL